MNTRRGNPLMTPFDAGDHARREETWQYRVRKTFMCVLDTGCWLGDSRYFGMLSGDTVALLRHDGGKVQRDDGLSVADPIIREILRRLPSVRLMDHEMLVPVSQHEMESDSGVLTDWGSVVVFIPDTHLGLRDEADDFANSNDGDLANLEYLVTLLRGIAGVVGRDKMLVVQTGDFFEIWETEAYPPIYLEDSASAPKIYPKGDPPVDSWRRNRQERAQLAADEICSRWRNVGSGLFEELLDYVDVYLLGNHDAEWKFVETDVGLRNMIARNSEFSKGEVRWDSFVCRNVGVWEAEHSHRWDGYNNTIDCASLEDIMREVKGKSITFEWARMERYRSFPQRVYIKDPLDKSGAEGVALIFGPRVLANPPLSPVSVVSLIKDVIAPDVRSESGFTRWIRKFAEGRFTGGVFAEVRRGLVDELARRLAGANPGCSVRARGGVSGSSYGSVSFLALGMNRPSVPFRLFVHSHTHRPTLARIPIEWYPMFDPPKDGYHNRPFRNS